ncbi:hypothetical protein V6K52_19770 [Knoellia sp. S7-12]|uniref:hypothetical protein n=1 Tax=Knoellia sp. S7-12 TaxID=3126698 RepID=UPI0033678B0B
MDCRSCGVDLPRDAVYCLRCGARVELGSVLGVGTDLPPAAPRDLSRSPEIVPDPDLSETAVLPRLPQPPASPPAHPVQPVQPVQQDEAASPNTSGHSRGTILAMVATFVALAIIGTFALTRILGSDAPALTATAASVSPTSATEGQDAPTESSAEPETGPSTQAAPTPTTTPSESGATIPAGARRCSTTGSDAVATAYAATERTSCEFAGAVREAYRKAGTPDGVTTLRAYSPVTSKWYSLSCDGGEPVRCTSTTNAVVLLAP